MTDKKSNRDPLVREANAKAARGEAPARAFIHLRVHSAYSLLEGALPLGKIIGRAVADAAPAVAVTDTNNLFGALEFAQKATKDGVQPIIGCQLDVDFGDIGPESGRGHARRVDTGRPPLVLIAATEAGYANLVKLVSRAWLDNAAGAGAHVKLDWLAERAEGIICLTGGPRGPIGAALKADHAALAEARLMRLKEIFGDRLYVELERLSGHDRALEAATIDLAYRQRAAAGGHQRGLFPLARRFRGA